MTLSVVTWVWIPPFNRFFLLSKPPPPLHPLFLTDNIKMDRIPVKIKWKIHCYLHCISSFEGNSWIKICKMSHQIFYFLLFYTSLYIIQHTSFFTNFYNFSSLNIICKKDFRHEFSFFNGSTETLAPTHLTAKIC